MRLNQFLSRAGVTSRRGADRLIQSGQVSVNAKTITELGTQINPEKDRVKVSGKRVQLEEFKYFIFHKPQGMISTLKDPQERQSFETIVESVGTRVVPVGRLDYNTEGLILLTNDGELVHRFLHPKFQVPRKYHVKVKGILTPEEFEKIKKGIHLEDGKVYAEVKPLHKLEKNSELEVVVREGRNHLIRRLMLALGHPVIKLTRIGLGPLVLGALPKGQYRRLYPDEVKLLKAWVVKNTQKSKQNSTSKLS
jgi:pseudouridine synthase